MLNNIRVSKYLQSVALRVMTPRVLLLTLVIVLCCFSAGPSASLNAGPSAGLSAAPSTGPSAGASSAPNAPPSASRFTQCRTERNSQRPTKRQP
jgi:hypothetical protein